MILELAVGYNPNTLVSTLQIGYPHEQALSQDKESDVHPRAATYPAVPDPTSLLRWALGLSCVQWLQIPPPCVRRALAPPCAQWLWTLAPAREGSSVVTCVMTPDPATPLERALTLPHVLWLQALPPRREDSDVVTRHAVSCGLWAIRKALADLPE
jgi:hypothetical protein